MTERAGQTVEPVEPVEAQMPGEAVKPGQTTGPIRPPEAAETKGPAEALDVPCAAAPPETAQAVGTTAPTGPSGPTEGAESIEAVGTTAPTGPTEPTGPDDPGPRIYVACLAAYNAGHLHGRWIEATQDADAIRGEIEAMLKASPIPLAEEFAIHDYEGFEGAKISEYTGIADVADLAAFIDEHGKLGAELFQYFDGDMDEAAAALEDHAGQFKSLGHFAAELTEESAEVPVHLALYIDYDAMGRDMELSGDIFTIQTGFECVHVFWAR